MIATISAVYFYPAVIRYMMTANLYSLARSEVSLAEDSIRLKLASPLTYECTNNGGIKNCRVLSATLIETARTIPERMKCTACRVVFSDNGTLRDKGTDLPHVTFEFGLELNSFMTIRSSIDLELQQETLLRNAIPCDGILRGIASDGSEICQKGFSRRAEGGEYITEVDPQTFEIKTKGLPETINECERKGQFISRYTWLGADRYKVDCRDRLEPEKTL